MSKSFIKLNGELRSIMGTGPSRSLRREGKIPAIIYGSGKQNMQISVQEKEITKLYKQGGISTKILDIEIDGKSHKVLTKKVDIHPVKEIANHVDFVYLESKNQKVSVPIEYKNKENALGVKRGGFFNIVKRKILLLCPVDAIPGKVSIDVSKMRVGQSIKASDLFLEGKISLVDKGNTIIASITGRGKDQEETSQEANQEEDSK